MWTRSELKARAKDVLRTSYWKAFLVSLVLAILGGGSGGCSFNSGFGGGSGSGGGGGDESSWTMPGLEDPLSDAAVALIIIFAVIAIFVFLGVMAFVIFVRAPLEVGARQYFKQSALGDVNMNYLGYAFAKGKYLAIVKSMFWRAFLNFLWYLLLFVPGIVKGYAYRMVPYILADNPGIGSSRAVELSNRMTRGQKWKMFVLDLSFIGWYLLGVLALIVGTLFVLPYDNATKAELYLVLRRQALEDGISSREELNLIEA